MLKFIKSMLMLVVLVTLSSFQYGCMKPYDKPEYVEVKSSETAFVIPLEDNVEKQVKFDSAKYLEGRKVSGKRIPITHRWNRTGRWETNGAWIPTVKVVLVNRSPETRTWETNDPKQRGNAIWVESADSIGFSMGWNCTAYIKEEDCSQFLYMYPSGSLASVMDSEVRAMIQQETALFSAKYPLDVLRTKKNELAESVKSFVVAFFEKRGITITTIGMCGGMTYENPEIQKKIDETFVIQQEKVNASSMLAAQEDKNKRIKSEAEAVATAAVSKAKGEADGKLLLAKTEADGKLMLAETEAKGIRLVSQAITEANNNPQLVQLKQIEVDKVRAEKWTGHYPTTIIGSGANTWVGLNGIGTENTQNAVTTPTQVPIQTNAPSVKK